MCLCSLSLYWMESKSFVMAFPYWKEKMFSFKKGKIFIYLFKRPRYMCIVNYSSGNWCLGFVYVALTPPPVERRRAHRPPRLRQKWFFDDAPFRRLCFSSVDPWASHLDQFDSVSFTKSRANQKLMTIHTT